jgi:hypothetical protein
MKISDGWRIEVAATLSQVGAVTLSPQIATKLYQGSALSPEEQASVDRLPAIAAELLKPIPRLQAVRELISVAFGAHGGAAPRALEAQVLRACVEYDASQASGLAGTDTLAQLKRNGYDPALLEALSELVAAESSPARVIDVALADLRPGMVLAEDVYSSTGTLLLARGHSIKENVIERLRTILPNLAGRHAVRVRLSD